MLQRRPVRNSQNRINAASDAILENIKKNSKDASADVNFRKISAAICCLPAYDYQEFGKGDEVNIETQFRSLLLKSGLDLTAMCKAHVDRLKTWSLKRLNLPRKTSPSI
jgi:hypothetical protein